MFQGFENRKKQFWNSYNKLLSLVLKGREVELLMRICVDANSRAKTYLDKTFEDFTNKTTKQMLKHVLGINAKNFGTLINETMPDESKDELHAIRDIAGALAHAKINQAKKDVDAYLNIYKTKNIPNKNTFPGVLIEHIRDNSGHEYGLTYHPDFSKHNTMMQEWQIFEFRGYVLICEEVFNKARLMISNQFNSVVLEESMSTIYLAMKNGKIFYYTKEGKRVWKKPNNA